MATTRLQATGDVASSASSISKAFASSLTTGSLVVVTVARYSGATDLLVVGDIGSSGGTATLGTWTLDAVVGVDTGSGNYQSVGVFSAPVTDGGTSPTVTVSGASGYYFFVGLAEFSEMDLSGARVEDTATGTAASGGTPSSGDATSAGAAVFVGLCGTNNWENPTTFTEDAAFTSIYASTNGASDTTGEAISRIVTSGTTDAASWTAPTDTGFAAALAVYKVYSTTNGDVTGVAGTATAAGGVPVAEGLNPGTIFSTVEL